MKTAPLVCLCAALAACTPTSPAPGPMVPADRPQAAPDARTGHNLIIFYDSPQAEQTLLAAVDRYGAALLYRYRHLHAIAIAIPADKDVGQATAHFTRQPGVAQVLRDQFHPLDQQGTL